MLVKMYVERYAYIDSKIKSNQWTIDLVSILSTREYKRGFYNFPRESAECFCLWIDSHDTRSRTIASDMW